MAAPHDSELSVTSRRVLNVLRSYSTLAWPILKAQCELAGLDPVALGPEDVALVLPRLRTALARFTNTRKGESFERELLREPTSSRDAPDAEPGPPSQGAFSPPSGLVGLVNDVLRVLASYTPLAWPIVEVQCSRANIHPNDLDRRELQRLIPALIKALGRFSSPEKAESAAADLQRLVGASST